MQWTYEIRGSHPHYKIPEVGTGRIANKLSKEVQQKLKQQHTTKKNFLRTNQKNVQLMSKSPKKDGQQSLANLSYRGNAGMASTAGGLKARDLSNERSTF